MTGVAITLTENSIDENPLTLRLFPIKRLATAFLVCCFTTPTSYAAAGRAAAGRADIQAVVDSTIRPVMAKYGIPGMAVAVTVDGEAMFFNYGVASKQERTPVSENTLFELGSVSKTITATLACYAQGLGRLSFDDHPGRYLPQLKGSPIDAASVLDLGTYAAGGLPQQFPEDVTDDARMLAYFRDWKPDAPPGTQRRYSNPSLGLFGQTVALALQSDFGDAVEQRLLPAFGMTHSFVRVPAGAMAQYAWGYDKAGKPVRVRPDVFDAQTYGVKSTTADMIRYVQANIEPGRLAAPFQRAVDCTHVGYFQVGDMVQGLGWEQYRAPVTLQRLLSGNSEKMMWEPNPASSLTPPQPAPRGTLFNKTGSTRGFGAYVAFKPEQRIGIVILANRSYPIPARVTAAYTILEQLAKGTQAAAIQR
jgi:beta-lactamase class C